MLVPVDKWKRRGGEEQEETKAKVSSPFPPPPDWMGFEAKCEWLRAGKDMWNEGGLEDKNLGMFENYCIAIGVIRECENMLAVDGKIVGGKAHPAFKMMIEAMAQAKAAAISLRFVRSAPRIKEEEDDNWGRDKRLLA